MQDGMLFVGLRLEPVMPICKPWTPTASKPATTIDSLP
jgi:hypothetical protein